MNAQKFSLFCRSVGVTQQFQYELEKAPDAALKAIGFSESETAAIIEELKKEPDFGNNPEKPEPSGDCIIPIG